MVRKRMFPVSLLTQVMWNEIVQVKVGYPGQGQEEDHCLDKINFLK